MLSREQLTVRGLTTIAAVFERIPVCVDKKHRLSVGVGDYVTSQYLSEMLGKNITWRSKLRHIESHVEHNNHHIQYFVEKSMSPHSILEARHYIARIIITPSELINQKDFARVKKDIDHLKEILERYNLIYQ